MTSPSNISTTLSQDFHFQKVIENFIQHGVLPENKFTPDQINELANRVLLSGQATPEHFENLRGVTVINTETMKTPIPTRVLEAIFTQYKDSLKELKIGRLEPDAELHIPHSLTHLKVLHLPPSVSPLQAKAILLSAFQHAEEEGVEEYRAKTAHIQEKFEQERTERLAGLQRTWPERKESSKKQKQEREKRYLDSPHASQMPEETREAHIDSHRAPGELSQTHTPNTAKRQRTREEPIDDSTLPTKTSGIPILDRVAAPPQERAQEPMLVKITTLEQLELLSLTGAANARIDLDLSQCKNIDDETLQKISTELGSQIVRLNVSGLRHLQLQGCHFPNLEWLNAGSTGITDAILRQIAETSPGLKELHVFSCTNVTLEGCSFPNLEWLNAGYTPIADTALRQIAETSPGLKELHVFSCTNVTLEGCSFPNLEGLDAGYTPIADTALRQIAETSQNLKHLNITGCKNVTLKDCSFPNLEGLDAGYTPIADTALRQIAETSQNLKHLNITGCTNVTLKDCSFPNLERLVAMCTSMKDEILHQIAQTSPGLKHLDLTGCSNVTLSRETIKQLNPAWQNLQVYALK